ncbi:alpha/beta hydrolase, partial [Pseudomonas sp. BGM005]|nr:alpha/beta hydrolase [Pseudomonas sp. BG5]
KPAGSMDIKETKDGKYLYLDPGAFAADFAADLPKAEADFLAKSQVFAAKQAFAAKIAEPAWRTKPSWSIVATGDHAINPDLEREMA